VICGLFWVNHQTKTHNKINPADRYAPADFFVRPLPFTVYSNPLLRGVSRSDGVCRNIVDFFCHELELAGEVMALDYPKAPSRRASRDHLPGPDVLCCALSTHPYYMRPGN